MASWAPAAPAERAAREPSRGKLMDKRREAGLASRRGTWFRVTAAASSAALLGLLGLAGTSFAAPGSAVTAAAPGNGAKAATLADDSSSTCHLGNGVKHVVQITFDNVHFFRDNPNVPSDFELMPNLLNFFENNGTFLSNNHTPLIAHTADDILTTYTGMYGDRQGMPISNDYETYNTERHERDLRHHGQRVAFAYWTDPIDDTASPNSTGHDTNPNMVYSPVPPATAQHAVDARTRSPRRPGCRSPGPAATSATSPPRTRSWRTPPSTSRRCSAPNSPEAQQLAADPDSFKDPETADYVGVAVHCAQSNAFCADGQGGEVRADLAHRRPRCRTCCRTSRAGTAASRRCSATGTSRRSSARARRTSRRNGYEVTNAAGNLVDLNGNQINGAFLTNHPGFPGFGTINASQTLAYMADMLESGVPVVSGYISDLHGNEHIPGAVGGLQRRAGDALGSGSACYIAQAQYYNQAFGTFFQRLAADGITPANTLFIVSSDEGDHEAGRQRRAGPSSPRRPPATARPSRRP